MKPRTLGTMWADLLTSEMAAKSAQHHVTTRAKIYLEAGLELERVLDALKISRATWYRRAAEHDAWRADNATAAGQILSKQADDLGQLTADTCPKCGMIHERIGDQAHDDTLIVVDGDDLDADYLDDLPECTSATREHAWSTIPGTTIEACDYCGLHVKDDR